MRAHRPCACGFGSVGHRFGTDRSGPALPTTDATYLTLLAGGPLRDLTLDELDAVHRLAEIFLLEHPELVGEYDERGAIRAIRRVTDIDTRHAGAGEDT